jgi:hypothetical protein
MGFPLVLVKLKTNTCRDESGSSSSSPVSQAPCSEIPITIRPNSINDAIWDFGGRLHTFPGLGARLHWSNSVCRMPQQHAFRIHFSTMLGRIWIPTAHLAVKMPTLQLFERGTSRLRIGSSWVQGENLICKNNSIGSMSLMLSVPLKNGPCVSTVLWQNPVTSLNWVT